MDDFTDQPLAGSSSDDPLATAPPRRASRLLNAILQALSDVGPSPTAFRASPAAEYTVDGQVHRTAPGWWVAFSCRLEIASLSEPGSSDEVVVLSFHGSGVHGGERFSWEFATATDALGQRRIVLQDNSTYPEPLLNMLQYHAIGECRDALLQRTAMRLGQQLNERTGLRSVVTSVLTALGFMRERAQAASRYDAANAVPPPEEHYAERYPYARSVPPHINLDPPPPGPAVYHMLDETPRAASALDAAADALPPIFGQALGLVSRRGGGSKAATARSSASAGAAAPSAVSAAEAFFLKSSAASASGSGTGGGGGDSGGGSPTGGGELATAELFGISQYLDPQNVSDWNIRVPESPAEGGERACSSQEAAEASYVGRGSPYSKAIEDQIDSLRTRHPERSSESLRQLVLSQQHY